MCDLIFLRNPPNLMLVYPDYIFFSLSVIEKHCSSSSIVDIARKLKKKLMAKTVSEASSLNNNAAFPSIFIQSTTWQFSICAIKPSCCTKKSIYLPKDEFIEFRRYTPKIATNSKRKNLNGESKTD